MAEFFVADNLIETKEFVKHAIVALRNKEVLTVSAFIRLQVQDIAVEHLGLKDLNQLRDRLDGSTYMCNLLLKVVAVKTVEKHLGVPLMDMKIVKTDKRADFTKIVFEGNSFRVIPFFYGTLPIIDQNVSDQIILCAIRRDFKSAIICGKLHQPDFSDVNLFTSVGGETKRNFRKFIGFQSLQPIAGSQINGIS